MVTATVERAAETQDVGQEKSMTALAEKLREGGVRVSQTVEYQELNGHIFPPTILFDCEGESQALEIAEIALAHEYPLIRLKRKVVL